MRTEKFYPEGQQLLTFSSSHSSRFPRKFSSCLTGAAAAFAAPGFGSAQREPVARRLPGLPGARPRPREWCWCWVGWAAAGGQPWVWVLAAMVLGTVWPGQLEHRAAPTALR